MRFATQSFADELLFVRLRLLHQPAIFERAAGAVFGVRGRDAHDWVLQAKLYRRVVSFFGHHSLARLYDGANDARASDDQLNPYPAAVK
jgi:hypothetical protein